MIKVKYRERIFLDRYRCIERNCELKAISYFKPKDTDLYYFKVDNFNYVTIAKEDIYSITEEKLICVE